MDILARLNKPAFAADIDQTLWLLIELSGEVDAARARLPLQVVTLVDASGTMFRFQFTPEQYQHWRNLAQSRGEIQAAYSDAREVRVWRGETLDQLRREVPTPMGEVVRGLMSEVEQLGPHDQMSVIAFADRARVLFDSTGGMDKPACLDVLQQLRDQPGEFQLGNRTFMAKAIEQAGEFLTDRNGDTLKRLVIITDGLVHDPRQTQRNLHDLRARGLSVTTLGIGEEFDEEFLMSIADRSGGEYYYCENSGDLETRLKEEFKALRATVLRDLEFGITGENGATILELYQATPAMRMFEEVDEEMGWMTVRVGQAQADRTIRLLAKVAVPPLDIGEYEIARMRVQYRGLRDAPPTEDSAAVFAAVGSDVPEDEEVRNLVDRLEVYLATRRAQWATEDQDFAIATRNLRDAAGMATRLGETNLAEQLEEHAVALETGEPPSPTRTKRIKAATRRLA